MPSKVQLKLLSNSGELLSLVTCNAGKISVLRAGSPSDLRPYQRALAGSSAKDNLEIVCDGSEYRPDQHTLIGFGEPAPTSGQSVKQFLTSQGVPELAVDSLLLSIGLETIALKQCSELTADQEARLRLAAATTTPEKVLVLNDPFENVASQWRERTAEMLSSYARTRKALIIIPSLSYRPECWIDNETVERIEVGQTSQRTIGFGSAGSQSNAMVEDIRAKLRQDPRFAGQTEPDREKGLAAAAALVAGVSVEDLGETTAPAKASLLPSVLKVASVLLGVSAGGWLAVSFSNLVPAPKDPEKPQQVAALNQAPPASAKTNVQPQPPSEASSNAQGAKPAEPARLAAVQKEPAVEYVLDKYPAVIRTALIDTSRGVTSFSPPTNTDDSEGAKTAAKASGNLFSLLEKAGSKKSDSPQAGQSWSEEDSRPSQDQAISQQTDGDLADEQERREAIRQRFLQAIQAAAARREATSQEDIEDDAEE
jgi:hypothetical protein